MRDLVSRDGIEEVTQALLIVGGKRGRAEHRDRRRDVLHPLLALLRGHDNFGGFRARDLGGGSIGRRAGPLQRLRKSDRWTSRTDRKSVVSGKRVSVRLDHGDRRTIKNINHTYTNLTTTHHSTYR